MTKREFNIVCTKLRDEGRFGVTKFIIKSTKLTVKQAWDFINLTIDIPRGSKTTRKDYYKYLDKKSKGNLRMYNHLISEDDG